MFAQEKILPFSAIVGQEPLKAALLIAAVNPRLNGVLIRGDKGTAKSTAARSLAGLMPPALVNEGCRYGCDSTRPSSWCDECRDRTKIKGVLRPPAFETLPLGVTEDQLLGTLDIEHALRHGEKRFSPGLLASVNQGVLYVDEVNLLDDHIVDLLLDSAAMGVNVVAREGVSVRHPAEFVLIGTMNPEEGHLRPQLLDRFGLCAEIGGIEDPDTRAEVTRRYLSFERDPASFRKNWEKSEKELAKRIANARTLLPNVELDERWIDAAAQLSLSLGVHGHRADILMVKASATLAALDGRKRSLPEDFERAAELVYPHRLRKRPFEEAQATAEDIRERARELALEAIEEEPPPSPPKKKTKKRA